MTVLIICGDFVYGTLILQGNVTAHGYIAIILNVIWFGVAQLIYPSVRKAMRASRA